MGAGLSCDESGRKAPPTSLQAGASHIARKRAPTFGQAIESGMFFYGFGAGVGAGVTVVVVGVASGVVGAVVLVLLTEII